MWLKTRRHRALTITTATVRPIPGALPGTECLAIRVTNGGPTVASIQSVGIRLRGDRGHLPQPAEWLGYNFPVALHAGERWSAPLVPIRRILRELNASFRMRFWWRDCWRLSAVVDTPAHGQYTEAFVLPNRVPDHLPEVRQHDGWDPPVVVGGQRALL